MSFLQRYPLESVGGIEKVLQTAFDLASQHQASMAAPRTSGTAAAIGARLRDTVWKGFSSGLEYHPEEEGESTEEESEDGEAAFAPARSSMRSKARQVEQLGRKKVARQHFRKQSVSSGWSR